jgi:hypothetical protein
MGFPTRCLLFAVPAMVLLWGAAEPRYDTATVVTVRMLVAEIRETPKGSPLAGIHLMARPESARADSEPWDVYLGPTDFMKDMDLVFQPHDRLDVVGSKIKVGAATVILAREIRRSGSALYLRDEKGEPVWKALEGGS